MDRDVSIVRVDTRKYRVIAQEHWGLTKEQMKGMHVHHRIPRSKGGTNDPSNLYVCSPWFHDVIWHEGTGGFIELAVEGGRKGGKKGGKTQGRNNAINETGFCAPGVRERAGKSNLVNKVGIFNPDYTNSDKRTEDRQKGGNTSGPLSLLKGYGIFDPNYLQSEKYLEDRIKAGLMQVENKTGCFNPDYQNSEKAKEDRRETGRITSSQKWKCTVTGYMSSPGPLTLYQKARGIDPINRVRVF